MNIVLCARARQQFLLPARGWFFIRWRGPRTRIVTTGAKSEEFVQQVQRSIDCSRIGIRAKIAIAVALKTAHAVDPRKIFRQRYLNVRIVFIIAHQYIVPGAILFDIVAFQHQCLDLVLDDHKLNIVDLCHHTSIFRAEVSGLLEIRTHTIIE